jgi:competence protein ComEC
VTDRAVIALALAVCVGAWLAVPVPVAAALVVVLLSLAARRPWLVVLGAAVLASGLGGRAAAGVEPPATPVAVDGEVELLGDPVGVKGAVRVDVRVDRRRVEAWARGAAGAALEDRAAGERIVVRGRMRPPADHRVPWLARRHVSAQLDVKEVGPWRAGHLPSRLANGLRRTLVDGASSLDRDRRALFTGFVLGDVREQTVEVADDFRGAGLTHLLAVSGSNVAFVLMLAAPVLRRLGLRGRWVATLALIAFFALVTRFEPSVLRASAMAAIACSATGLGRPASRHRILALAVAAVVLVDPFIVRSVAFQLSVGASTGIITLAGAIGRLLPGPRSLADLVAVTVAAQVGVAPVLVPVFGGLPVSSLPANVLAVPAAGPLTSWGLTAGLLAGLAGPPLDRVLHLPTSLLTGWVAGVARWGSALPLGQLRAPHVVGLIVLAVVGVTGRRRPLVTGVAVTGAVFVLLSPMLRAPASHPDGLAVARGAHLHRAGGAAVVVLDEADPARLLDRLRLEGVDRIDVLVSTRGNKQAAATVLTLRSRLEVRAVLAPDGHKVRDAVVPVAGAVVPVGGLVVEVGEVAPVLDVAVRGAVIR